MIDYTTGVCKRWCTKRETELPPSLECIDDLDGGLPCYTSREIFKLSPLDALKVDQKTFEQNDRTGWSESELRWYRAFDEFMKDVKPLPYNMNATVKHNIYVAIRFAHFSGYYKGRNDELDEMINELNDALK